MSLDDIIKQNRSKPPNKAQVRTGDVVRKAAVLSVAQARAGCNAPIHALGTLSILLQGGAGGLKKSKVAVVKPGIAGKRQVSGWLNAMCESCVSSILWLWLTAQGIGCAAGMCLLEKR
jgi:hypothetical protein